MARSDELEENDDKSTAGDGTQNGEKRYTDMPVTLATTSETSKSRENDATPFLDSNERRQNQKSERSGDDNQNFGAKLWSNVKGIGKAAALVIGLLITTIYITGSLNRESSLEKKQRDTIDFKSAGPAVMVTPLDEKPEKTLPPPEPQTAIRLPTKDGKEQVIFVPKRLAEQFTIEAITEIEKNRQALLAEADKRIGESIMPTFDRMSQRARMFVDWYYSSEGEFSFDAALLSSAQENLMSATRSLSLRARPRRS
ncbi:hypothetical protein F1643_07745 [Azospirillum sp. INR13]|uniref:hypothetical protein n=1 Tax=Azospirillum sp. INR13 TaxID=2596919 RepID=UPI00189242C7|nr:hypothetical protein [Azospirillum sp. INR13]MBF5094392.1 hypothetical protein [Azospirillum sp. INR13]